MSQQVGPMLSLEQLKSLCGTEQLHLLAHWESLTQIQRQGLADQIAQIDFDGIGQRFGLST